MELTGRILVLGLGVSGLAVADHLAELRCHGARIEITVVDSGRDERLSAHAERLERAGVEVRLGVERVQGEFELVVASPGIPPESSLMRSARALGVEIVSEVELAARLARSPFVAVTGTNGKTTVTTMIAHLLQESGVPVEMVGNIGTPVIEVVEQAGEATVLVAEVSSFQLALTRTFHPRVGVLLNITPDHLDWHGTMEAYAADKARIFANHGRGDTAVIVVDDPGAASFADSAAETGAVVVRVSLSALHPGGASVVDGVLVLDRPDGPLRLLRADELTVRGDHNLTNALSAAVSALAMGASVEGVVSGLRTFQPAAHRLEPVEWVGGAEYYDDSKATNPDAVTKALTAFDDRPIIVLLGGRNKDNPFGPLASDVDARCKAAVLFGEAADEIADAFVGKRVPVTKTPRLADAVAAAAALAEPGDVVLLSPACASFDEFTGYAARGDAFREAVLRLAEERGDR